jgi:hypothetical protein
MSFEPNCFTGSCRKCGFLPQEEPKPVWKQIIEDCGGKEAFMEATGLKPKQETIEEAIDRIAKEDGYDIDGSKVADFVDGMVKGAKWQQEQDKNKYSEEEVKEILNLRLKWFGISLDEFEDNKWFNQFKKIQK